MPNGNKKKKNNSQAPFIIQRVVMALLFLVVLLYIFREPMNLQQQPEEIGLSDYTKLLVAKKVETAVRKDFTISGRVDDLILVKASGKSVLVEVKSTKNINFVKKPQSSHEMQLVFYMHASGVHNGIVLYVDKSNLQSKTFEVPYTKEKADEILGRFRLLHDSLANNSIPEAEASKNKETTWMCKWSMSGWPSILPWFIPIEKFSTPNLSAKRVVAFLTPINNGPAESSGKSITVLT